MKYALIIGNNRYDDPKLAQLKTPAADSQALAKVLGDTKIGAFDEVTPLINQTESQVRRSISSFLINKKPDDLVMLYFSGHGVLDDRGRLYLALRDTQVNLLKATSIPSSFLADEMDSCRSKRQILVLDCCHSGAFERGTKGEQKAITETTFEGSGFGRVVLTASDSTQYALEGDQVIKQTELSLFTHFLLEGLKTGEADTNNDGLISLDEWYDYTYTRVISETPRQVPHKWSYNQQGDLVIARNPFLKKRVVELPYELVQALESSFVGIRESAVNELGSYLKSRDADMAQLARASLERMQADDSRRISSLAEKLLAEFDRSRAPALQVSPIPPQPVLEATAKASPSLAADALASSAANARDESLPLSKTQTSGSDRSTQWRRFITARPFWLKWAATSILGIVACLAINYYYTRVNDSSEALRTQLGIAGGLIGLVQWGLFRNRLEFWWFPVNMVTLFGLGTVHKYLFENTGWGMEGALFLMLIWLLVNFILGLVFVRAQETTRNTSPIVESGARQDLFVLLLSISLILGAIISLFIVLEYYDFFSPILVLYGISAILVSASFVTKGTIPRNFGFITLAIFLLFDGILAERMAYSSETPLHYFTLNAIVALASGIFFVTQRETWKNAGFILLSGYLIAVGASSIVLYDTATDRVLSILAALCAISAAIFFFTRKGKKA